MEKVVSKIRATFLEFRKPLLISLGLLAAQQLGAFFIPYFTGKIIDAAVGRSNPLYLVELIVGAFVVHFSAHGLLPWCRNRYELWALDFSLPRRLASEAMRKLFSLSLSQHSQQHSEVKRDVFTRGPHGLESFIEQCLYNVFPAVAELTVIAVGLLFINVKVAGLVWIGIACFAICIWREA